MHGRGDYWKEESTGVERIRFLSTFGCCFLGIRDDQPQRGVTMQASSAGTEMRRFLLLLIFS